MDDPKDDTKALDEALDRARTILRRRPELMYRMAAKGYNSVLAAQYMGRKTGLDMVMAVMGAVLGPRVFPLRHNPDAGEAQPSIDTREIKMFCVQLYIEEFGQDKAVQYIDPTVIGQYKQWSSTRG